MSQVFVSWDLSPIIRLERDTSSQPQGATLSHLRLTIGAVQDPDGKTDEKLWRHGPLTRRLQQPASGPGPRETCIGRGGSPGALRHAILGERLGREATPPPGARH